MRIRGRAVFSDESRHTASRFRSIAAVSLPANDVVETRARIAAILSDSDVREFKWNRLNGARKRFCANALIDHFLDEMVPSGARVDIVTWDTQDSRHSISRRDDRKNFERMFFHLHSALFRRGDPGEVWHLRPDERLDVDWATIQECLVNVGMWQRGVAVPLFGTSQSLPNFEIGSLEQVQSKETPLCQLADLFAGMASYTRDKSQVITDWLDEEAGQLALIDPATLKMSGTDRQRCAVIGRMYRRCRQNGLRVSLRSRGYFRTGNPSGPVNFWNYQPQHDGDRAPTLDG